MAGKPLGPNEMTIVARGAWKDGRDARYRRNLAGLTVQEALTRIKGSDQKAGVIPAGFLVAGPYHLNGGSIQEDSTMILYRGDVLSVDP